MGFDRGNRAEVSLLLFLETRAVDHGGRVDTRHMNKEDMDIAKAWNESGFLRFGRIALEDANANGGSWVEFTDEAWAAAHQLRMERGKRGWSSRRYKTTEESREAEAAY